MIRNSLSMLAPALSKPISRLILSTVLSYSAASFLVHHLLSVQGCANPSTAPVFTLTPLTSLSSGLLIIDVCSHQNISIWRSLSSRTRNRVLIFPFCERFLVGLTDIECIMSDFVSEFWGCLFHDRSEAECSSARCLTLYSLYWIFPSSEFSNISDFLILLPSIISPLGL